MSDLVLTMAKNAKIASRMLAMLGTSAKNHALLTMADGLLSSCEPILAANEIDLSLGAANGLTSSLLDRLRLTPKRIAETAVGLRQLSALPDPVGEIVSGSRRPNGLRIERMRVPLGVIGIIYESRPNVTVDAAGICLKSGNAVILRGGSEAIHTNKALAFALESAVEKAGLPANTIQLIPTTDRESAIALMRCEGQVDLLIPRGGERLKKSVMENATVPVLTSLGGNCHTYIDASADLKMAADIAFNAKVSRPSVCNAMETLLVHTKVAESVLPQLGSRYAEAGIELRGCTRTLAYIPQARIADESDWETEFLAPILAIRIVDSLDEAIEHITKYGTGHSEAIVTSDYASSERFVAEIDAACVYVNASTRFTDGSEFGMGAEVGISTQKLHARGPIGPAELTTWKTIIRGDGQIRV